MSSLPCTTTFAQRRAGLLADARRERMLVWGKLALVCAMVSLSAMVVKDLAVRSGRPAALLSAARAWEGSAVHALSAPPVDAPLTLNRLSELARPAVMVSEARAPRSAAADSAAAGTTAMHHADTPAFDSLLDPDARFFDGRSVRPVQSIEMLVTAYSPDPRSCGHSADGITSSLHAVETNAFRLVAADTDILPLGSVISLAEYDGGNLVPVLDRGGAIKGRRLDVLFPTHEEAVEFGVKRCRVTVWAYADDGGNDWRKIRDSK